MKLNIIIKIPVQVIKTTEEIRGPSNLTDKPVLGDL